MTTTETPTTYTVREPGASAWAEGLTEREAIRAQGEARDAGLSRAMIIRDSDGESVSLLDGRLMSEAESDAHEASVWGEVRS